MLSLLLSGILGLCTTPDIHDLVQRAPIEGKFCQPFPDGTVVCMELYVCTVVSPTKKICTYEICTTGPGSPVARCSFKSYLYTPDDPPGPDDDE